MSWTAWGRPNVIAEPGMQWVAFRTSLHIWHEPQVDVYCQGGIGYHEKTRFTGSKFPTHRLWINGGFPVDEIARGPLSALWTPKRGASTFVA